MTDPILLPCILLTNDDGFDSPGLQALAGIAAEFTKELWIVAPEEDQSGTAQKISLRQAVSPRRRGEKSWSVKGTPSDCVALAIDFLMGETKPSLVLSGINATCNIGDEVNLSGTVGAAMTALMMGVPAIAISQDAPSRKDVPWETARMVLPLVLRRLLADGWRKETALCVNIPALPPEKIVGYSWARQGHKNILGAKAYRRVSPRGEEYFWMALQEKEPVPSPDNERAVMARGEVSVVALSADRSVEIAKPTVLFNAPEKKEEPLESEDEADDTLPEIVQDIAPADGASDDIAAEAAEAALEIVADAATLDDDEDEDSARNDHAA